MNVQDLIDILNGVIFAYAFHDIEEDGRTETLDVDILDDSVELNLE